MKMKISIIRRPCLTANLWSSNLVKRPAIGYLFFVTHKILEKLITLKFLDIKLLIFPTHLMQFFAMLVCPPKQGGVRNGKKVYLSDSMPQKVSMQGLQYTSSDIRLVKMYPKF